MTITASDIRCAGDAYFMALEHLGSSSDIVITCGIRYPLPASAAVNAFRRLIESHEELQCIKHRDMDSETWTWMHVPEAVWRTQLEIVCSAIEECNAGTLTTERTANLPFRLATCGDKTLEFRIDHTFGNGKAGYWWLERYFGLLSGPDNLGEAGIMPAIYAPRLAPAPIRHAIVHSVEAALSRYRAGAPANDIRAPFLRQNRSPEFSYRTNRYVFPRAQVEQVIARERESGESFTQTLTRALVEHVFMSYPTTHTVGVQVAADLHAPCGVDASAIGNFTGLLTGYVHRNRPVHAQVAILFARIRNGCLLGLIKLFAMTLRGQRRQTAWFKSRFKLVTQQAGDLMLDHLFLVSNLGIIEGPHTCSWANSVSLYAMTPSIYVSLSCINESATFESVFPTNIYEEQTVDAMLEDFFRQFELTPTLGNE